jgi:hypothetical protein
MATIGLVNQSKTIWHLWLTSRCLLEEVDRQWHEAREVFTQMEQMGLQQELYSSRFTASPVRGRSERSMPSLSSQPSYSPLSSQPSQFHSCEETMTYQTTMSLRIPFLPFCHYLPHLWAWLRILLLSAMTKMILTVCSVAQVIMRHDQHLLLLRYSFFFVKTVPIGTTFTSTASSTSVTIASCMPLTIVNLTVQTVEAGDFNLSEG